MTESAAGVATPAGTVAVRVVGVQKAEIFGPANEEHAGSKQIGRTSEEQLAIFAGVGSLDHPLGDPNEIVFLFEHSTALRQNIDSYATNIDGFGHRLEPIIDLEGKQVEQKIADALWMRRAREADSDEVPLPTDAEIAAERKRLELAMRREKLLIDSFVDYACLDHSFIRLRRRTRQELELLGNAFWEVERDLKGRVVELHYLQSASIRLMKLDDAATSFEAKVKTSDIDYGVVKSRRRFRRCVQVVGNQRAFFKEFGDPRVLSRTHGTYHASVEELRKADPNDVPANEIVHFKLDSPGGPMGMPRWAGGKLLVIGLRESQEVNRDYFEKKAVPPLAIGVSGGRFSDEAVKRLEDHFENNLKGKSNFHKILILEAEGQNANGDGGGGRTRIQFFPLQDAQLKDAIFGNYDVRCTDTLGFLFRLPRLLRGDVQDVNRASAESSLIFAEMQVFSGERQEFDDWINRKLFAEMGFRYWRFVSNGPIPRDSAATAELIVKMVEAGVITAEEAREFATDVFNRPLAKLVGDWLKVPFPLSVKRPPGGEDAEPALPPAPPGGPPSLPTEKTADAVKAWARELIDLRRALQEEEQQRALEGFTAARAELDGQGA